MKIVLIGTVSSSIFGFRKTLLQSMVKEGHEVVIFTTDLTPEIQQRARTELGVVAEHYQLERTGINPLVDLKNMWLLCRPIKKVNPDCVFCYFSKPVIWGALASRLAGLKNCYGMLEGLGYYFTEEPNGVNKKKNLIKFIQLFLFHLSPSNY